MIKGYLQVLSILCLYVIPIAIIIYVLDRIFNSEK